MRVSSDVDVSHLGLINQSRLKSGEPFPKCQFNVNMCVCVYMCVLTREVNRLCAFRPPSRIWSGTIWVR